MFSIVIIVAVLSLAIASLLEKDDCAISRAQCVACARRYGDTNGDSLIDVEEIRAVKANYLTWYERFFAFILSQSPERMMELCDADRDGFISEQDFADAKDTCLAECLKRELFWSKVCVPAQLQEALAAGGDNLADQLKNL